MNRQDVDRRVHSEVFSFDGTVLLSLGSEERRNQAREQGEEPPLFFCCWPFTHHCLAVVEDRVPFLTVFSVFPSQTTRRGALRLVVCAVHCVFCFPVANHKTQCTAQKPMCSTRQQDFNSPFAPQTGLRRAIPSPLC